MKYIFLIIFTSFVFAESFLTFQNINGLTAVENGIELIEPEATATNCILKLPFAHDTNYYNMSKTPDFSTSHNDANVHGATFQNASNGYDTTSGHIIANQHNETQSQFSVTFWVNPKSYQNQYANIIDFRDDLDKNNCEIAVEQISHQTNYFDFRGSSFLYFQLQSNEWQFVALTANSNVTAQKKIYINGQLNGTGHYSPALAGRLLIGRWSGYSSRRFRGYIDDVRIYNRALTSTEILNIYNVTSAAHPN